MPFLFSTERVLLGLAAGAIAATIVLLVSPTGPMRTLEGLSAELRFRIEHHREGGVAPDSSIVIVDIDEETLRRARGEFGRWPWPAAAHRAILETVGLGAPRVVGYAIPIREGIPAGAGFSGGPPTIYALVFEEPLAGPATGASGQTPPESSAELFGPKEQETESAEQEPAAHPGLRPFALPLSVPPPDPLASAVPAFATVATPPPALLSGAAGIGAVLDASEPEGVSRGAFLLALHQDGIYPSLPLALALGGVSGYDRLGLAGRRLTLDDGMIPLNRGRFRPHWRGGWSDSPFPIVPAWRLLEAHRRVAADRPPGVDLSRFAGKTVIVGASAASIGQFVPSPFGASQPASLLYATALYTLQSSDFLRVLPDGWEILFTIAAVVVTGLLAGLARGTGWRAVVETLVLILIASIAIGPFVSSGWIVPWVAPSLGALLAVVGADLGHGWAERRRRGEIQEAFGKFIPPNVVEDIADERKTIERRLERREITILFADVRNFTALAEEFDPERIAEQLNEFLSSMVEAVFRHDGTLDKYLGDGLMAFFGAPLPDPDHPGHACRAATGMLSRLEKLNSRWEKSGGPRFELGIGIHTGEALVGFIGDERRRMEYTAIGGAVNLASRLERLTRKREVPVIVSASTAERVGDAGVTVRRLEAATIRGRSEPVEVYALEPPHARDYYTEQE